MSNRLPVILAAVLALITVSPAPIKVGTLIDGRLAVTTVTVGQVQSPVLTTGDLDGDGLPETLENLSDTVSIVNGNETVWQSPDSWQVKESIITDLNRDGHPELTILVWRPFNPWPIDRYIPHGGRIDAFQTTDGMSCHIILVGWTENGYRELWAGSALAQPLLSFAAADLDGDGFQELIARETSYSDTRKGLAISIWEWNGFGFSLLDRRVDRSNRFQINENGSGINSLMIGP